MKGSELRRPAGLHSVLSAVLFDVAHARHVCLPDAHCSALGFCRSSVADTTPTHVLPCAVLHATSCLSRVCSWASAQPSGRFRQTCQGPRLCPASLYCMLCALHSLLASPMRRSGLSGFAALYTAAAPHAYMVRQVKAAPANSTKLLLNSPPDVKCIRKFQVTVHVGCTRAFRRLVRVLG